MTFPNRWRRWGFGLLLLAAASVGLLGRQAWRGEERVPAAAMPVSAVVHAAAAASWVMPAAASASTQMHASQGAAHTAQGSRADAGALVDVCGVGPVDRHEVEHWNPGSGEPPPPWQRALDLRKDAVLSRLAARLAVGPAHEQVAARLVMRDVEGAAAIAARSTDPQAHHLGVLACSLGGAPSCAALTTQAWARLDPADARPWMRLMHEAVTRRDEAAAAQALEQVIARDRRSTSSPLLEAVVQASAAIDDPAGLGLALIDVIGLEAAMLDSSAMATARYCSVDKLKDAARRGQCERWARWQFAHADGLLDAGFVTALADRLGMPASQRRFTRDDIQRAQAWLAEDSTRVLGYGCTSLRRTADWVTQRTRLGELQMALKAVSAGSP